MSTFIQAPLVNANEDSAIIIEWYRQTGDMIQRGEMLCMLETSKSTFELHADTSGYFEPLVKAGEDVRVGQIIAVLKNTVDEEFTLPESPSQSARDTEIQRRWTKKAEILANRHGLDLSTLSTDLFSNQTITEEDILTYLSTANDKKEQNRIEHVTRRTERVLIIGGGNTADLIVDILGRVPHQRAAGILDDNPKLWGTTVQGCPILGKIDDVYRLWKEKSFDGIILALGAMPLRANLYQQISQAGIPFANIIDPTSLILSDVSMGTGNSIMGFCRIGPQVTIGNNNFLSAYTNLEHHNRMGDHCTFGPGVITSGGVEIGNSIRFGTGIFIEPRLNIGDNSVIASGVILTTNVPAQTIVKTKANFTFSQNQT